MSNKQSNLKNKALISESWKTNNNISEIKLKSNKKQLGLTTKDLSLALNKPALVTNPFTVSAKEFPNASKQWINSVYSFNSNYVKNVASADNILNKILKSFFNLNPLANTGNGKKSRLIQRRFRRLSLNKLFLSKSEIKHSNDKVHVTIYLFNKKKRSLIYKINKLFNGFHVKRIKENLKKGYLRRMPSKSKYINSNSLNPKANNTRKWLENKKSLNRLSKIKFKANGLNFLKKIQKKYNGITLEYLRKIHEKYNGKHLKDLKNINASARLNWWKIKNLLRIKRLKIIKKYLLKRKQISSNKSKIKLSFKYRVNAPKRKVLFISFKKLCKVFGLQAKKRLSFKRSRSNRHLNFAFKNKQKNRYINSAFKNKQKNSYLNPVLNKNQKNKSLNPHSKINNSNRYLKFTSKISNKNNNPYLNRHHVFNFKPVTLNIKPKKQNSLYLLNLNPLTFNIKNQKSKKINNYIYKSKVLKLKPSSALPLNKFNTPRINNSVKSFIVNKSICKPNVSNIKNNYINYLQIKDTESSLKRYVRKMSYLTLSEPTFYDLENKFTRYLPFQSYSKNKILYYKELNNVTKNSIYKLFTNILLPLKGQKLYNKKLKKTQILPFNAPTLTLLRNYYNNFNKYKLYKLSIAKKKKINLNNNKRYNSKTFKTSLKRIDLFKANSMTSMSMHKLKELYKLFTLYNNNKNLQITHNTTLTSNDLSLHTNKSLNPSLNLNVMSSKLLLNTYKLLKEIMPSVKTDESKISFNKPLATYKRKSSGLYSKNLHMHKYNILNINRIVGKWNRKKMKNLRKRGKTIKNIYLKTHLTRKELIQKKIKKTKSIINIKDNVKNVRILTYFKRIDRFFSKYLITYLPENLVFINNNNIENICKPLKDQKSQDELSNKELALSISNSHVRMICKLNLLKLLFENESIYLNYIKLLSFNNALFKNWFLHNLKNTLSKIYNKNVILNIVNLKYIYLNSDILLNAIKIKLNKYRKNKVRRILKLIVDKVKINKVNREFFNLNNDDYKNVLSHFNNYKNLNTHVFNDLNSALHSDNNTYYQGKKANSLKLAFKNNYKVPSKLKTLNAIQYNTINYTKYKSVTGVRVEAAGRLTKRSTAARSVLSLRYAGSLRNNSLINNNNPSILLKNNKVSNLQFSRISSKTRNGSFGVKGWISSS